jgi:hypothetical protein
MPDRTVQDCRFNHEPEQQDWELSCPKEMPPGYRPFWRWVEGNVLRFGIEPVEQSAAVVQGVDKFDAMTDPDLQTLAVRMGVRNVKQMRRGDLIAAMRVKQMEVSK